MFVVEGPERQLQCQLRLVESRADGKMRDSSWPRKDDFEICRGTVALYSPTILYHVRNWPRDVADHMAPTLQTPCAPSRFARSIVVAKQWCTTGIEFNAGSIAPSTRPRNTADVRVGPVGCGDGRNATGPSNGSNRLASIGGSESRRTSRVPWLQRVQKDCGSRSGEAGSADL